MLYVASSTSANTGSAPHIITVDAEAKNVMGGTMTSSPGPMSWARRAAWRAVVPELVATPWATPTYSAKACSKAATLGPWARMPDSRTSFTASSSSRPSWGRAMGITSTPRGPGSSGSGRSPPSHPPGGRSRRRCRCAPPGCPPRGRGAARPSSPRSPPPPGRTSRW